MDTRRLAVLLELSRLGSMREVAEELGTTTSTVSQQIATLAKEVGTPLVEPDGRLSACAHVSGEPHFGGSTLRMAAAGWMTAAPLPAGAAPAPENVYRFKVVVPARRIADTSPPGG